MPVLQGSDWSDVEIVGFYQVVQIDYGRVLVQLTTETRLPLLGSVQASPTFQLYALNQFGLLSLKNITDKAAFKIISTAAIVDGQKINY